MVHWWLENERSRPRTEYSESLGEYATVFQAEVHAIERCARLNLDRKYRNADIAILSDSQAAIRALSSCVISSRLMWDCVDRLDELVGCNRVTLYWVPGQVGVQGNEKADELARKGAVTSFVGSDPFCGLAASTVRADMERDERRKR